ncbi:hypothetical protein [Paludisphaera rhizosphaerae]|uniref:hypothetical protein n=1 Tax=Paludisphaera rhizosphaerae TaxID=2711216 RepID=UPI0013EDA69E|nr:hypothetical protein [Paludisphaera rhizosphaerae]
MADPLVVDVPPGEYALPGTDRILVIEKAHWKPQTSPIALVTPAAPTPSTVSRVGSWLVNAALAAAGIAGGYYLGPAVADKVLPPDPPPVVVPTQSHSPSAPGYRPAIYAEPSPAVPSPQLPR